MKRDMISLDASKAGSIELSDTIFGLEPRADILHRVVRWQMAKRQAGTHKVKTRSETSYSGRKIYRQKGTGGARHGSRNSPIFRGGGVYKGPKVRSHAHNLPRSVRKLGLKMALSAKSRAGELVVVDEAKLDEGKTGILARKIGNLGWSRVLIIDGSDMDANFARAARSLDGVDILPSRGANVHDILRKDILVVTRAGVEALEARLK